jgi:hypothetical protein
MRARRLAQEAADIIGARASLDDVELRLFDDVIGAGLASQEGAQAIRDMARAE